MSEDFADKTEAPTPRRREQFRREGRVAVSGDLNGAAVMLTALLLLSATGPHLISAMEEMVRQGLSVSSHAMSPAELLGNVERISLAALLPLLLGIFVIAVLINLAQIGLPLNIQFPRRTERAGHSRVSPMNFITSLLKIAILSLIAWKVLWSSLGVVLASTGADFPSFASICVQVLLSAAIRIALVLLLFGLVDYAIQRYRLSQQLRMTRRELREDLRQTEGDPAIRSRQRRRRSMGVSPMLRGQASRAALKQTLKRKKQTA
jgi:flagellar biosynthetic protein FlhB